MNILAESIISNSEVIKNYKSCREKAEELGKLFIFKNNQPDAVLFSIAEYQRYSVIIEYMQSLDASEIEKLTDFLITHKECKSLLIDNTNG